MSVVPRNGTCPFDPTKTRCDPDCQLWIDREGRCAIRSIAALLWLLNENLAEIKHIFKKTA